MHAKVDCAVTFSQRFFDAAPTAFLSARRGTHVTTSRS